MLKIVETLWTQELLTQDHAPRQVRAIAHLTIVKESRLQQLILRVA